MRPRGKAGLKPRHNIIIGGKRTPGGLMGRFPGGGKVSLAGVRSPPLRGEAHPNAACLPGEGLETTLKAVFSEGRTPCVRVARPDSSRGIAFPPVRLR